MNKKILISLTTIAAIAIISIGATFSYFNDTETSTGNTFMAGVIDLKVDNECIINGQVVQDCTWTTPKDLAGQAIFNLTDVKPGDNGEDTISLHVDSNPAWICTEVSNIAQMENGCNPPEAKVDTTCDKPGPGQGELWDNLKFSIWIDNGVGGGIPCNNIKDGGETYLVENAKATNLTWPIADSQHGSPITDACIGVAWSVPSAVGNIIQGDSVTGDIIFKAYQARNNNSFLCNPPVGPVCGNGKIEQGEECDGDAPQVCVAAGGYQGLKTCTQCTWSSCEPTERCGDGIINDTEVCDDGALNGTSNHCNANCTGQTTPLCGNGTVESGEQCDDGNTTPGDGCSATCTKEPTITIHKDVVDVAGIGGKSPADFQMTIDNNNAAQDTAIYVSAGTHTISEVNTFGYDKTYSANCPAGVVDLADDQDITCTVTNTYPYFTVTVNKVVNNTCGGNNVLGDFNLFVGPYAVTSGVSKKVAVGTYLINESGVGGYNAVFSGACDNSTQLLTGANGDNKICTITNTDICPNIQLIKIVSGGSAKPNDFIMRVDTVSVPSAGSKSVTSNAGHTITEDTLAGYHFTSITGTGSQGSTCPTTLGGTVTLKEGEVITCTITNTAD